MCSSDLLQLPAFFTAVKNSFFNTAVTTVFSILVSTLSAYGFAKIEFPGREKIFKIYLFSLMMPGFLNIIPQFIILKNIPLGWLHMENGLIGTRGGLILIYVATNVCGQTFFLKNFFRELPNSFSAPSAFFCSAKGCIYAARITCFPPERLFALPMSCCRSR